MHNGHGNTRESLIDRKPVLDGGSAGWIAVFTLWTRGFIWVGIIKGLGIMLPTIQVQLETTTWIMGWITAMVSASAGLMGLSAGLIGRKLGSGVAIMACGLLSGVSLIAGSFASSVFQLGCTLILPIGTGLGVAGVLTKEAVAHYFDKNYAKATGVASTGYPISLLVLAPLIQLLLDTYGWRGCMLLLGGISMHLAVCGTLLMSARVGNTKDYQQLPQVVSAHQNSPPRHCISTCLHCVSTSGCYNLFQNFDVLLLRNFRYWAVAVIACCTKLAYGLWIIYFVSQVEANGFTLKDAATFLAAGSGGSLVSRVAQGFLADRGLIPYWILMCIAIIVTSISYCVTPWMTSFWAMMTVSCLCLLGDGALSCTLDVLTRRVLGVDLLAGAIGWVGVKTAMLELTVGFFPGWIYDTTGSYGAAFIFIGVVQLTSLVPLLILKYFQYVD